MNSGTKIPRKIRGVKNSYLRRAYRVIPYTDYNPGTSVPSLTETKMYAELYQTKATKIQKLGIKSLNDNMTVIPKMYDNIFDSNPALARAKKNFYRSLDGGEKIMIPLGYASTTASGWFEGADTLSTTDNEQITAAAYDWKHIYANVTITRADELKNSGSAAILSLVKNKVKMAEKTLADSLGTGIFNAGSTAKAIVGLAAICNTSSTVGGMSQSTYSWWASNLDSSTTVLSLAAIQAEHTNATVDNEKPSCIFTTRSLYDLFYSLLTPQQRFQDSDSARAGFTSLLFNGLPVLPDSHCPAGDWIGINEDHLHLFYHKDNNMKFSGFQTPINQAVKSAKIFWSGALGSSNNRLHYRLSAITA